MPFVLRSVFLHPLKPKYKARHSRRLRSAIPPLFDPPPPHTEDFRFSSLIAGSQSRQNYCFHDSLAARSSKDHPPIPIRLQTSRNSNTSIALWQFSLFFHTDEGFFLPVFQQFQCGTAVTASL
ncbi:hypothetical protein AVEN_220846-1 [Araneus ventricosus]|uniref:Uncharacterized protein n=1 Tax=Araneus ventricosus TaxID=182803 RepID=A0A4Y2QU84_ARAVE|nr:hypothetical protein AVEN_220846-1 [Araneus ventricosus]